MHRTELDGLYWLYCAAHAGHRFATCPQPRPGGASAARRPLQPQPEVARLPQGALLQPWPDHSQTGPSDNLVGSFCVTGIVGAMLDLWFRTVDVHWALPLAFYFYQRSCTCRSASGDSICTQLQTLHRSPHIRDRRHGPPRISHRYATWHSRRHELSSIFAKQRP